MKKKLIFLFFAFLAWLIIIAIFAISDVSLVWKNWGLQEDGHMVYPDFWNYVLLLLFKVVLYLIPPLIIATGTRLEDKRKKYKYLLLQSINYWFLIILFLKILFESVLELDRIFNLTVFNSVNDVQTFIGYLITFMLKTDYEVKPKIMEGEKQFSFSKEVREKYKLQPYKTTVKSIYNPQFVTQTEENKAPGIMKGQATPETRLMGVFALYYDGQLKKIGKAIEGGFFAAIGEYYNDDFLKQYGTNGIDKDLIEVEILPLNTVEMCWEVERYTQSQACIFGEKMPWQNKIKE